MAGVRLQDGRSSTEVEEMCRVEALSVKLRQRRLRWYTYGHVMKAEGGVLNEVKDLRGAGR